MEGSEFDLYNKCLFRTICVSELQTELTLRNDDFSPSDSYHILTLRLRKKILTAANVQSDIVLQLNDEIIAYNKSKCSTYSSYNCCIPGCSFRCTWHRKYIFHLEANHYNSASALVCNHNHKCKRRFPTVSLLRKHLKNDHGKQSSVQRNRIQFVESLLELKCSHSACNQTVGSISSLKTHIFTHLESKESVACPFCKFTTNLVGTMKSHISRKHRIQTIDTINPTLIVEPIIGCDFECMGQTTVALENNQDEMGEIESNNGDNECDIESSSSADVFIKALANTMNTWMNISGIPYCTVNSIVKEIFVSYERGMSYTKSKVLEKVREMSLDEDAVNKILDEMEEEDIFEKARKELSTEYKRKQYLMSSFPHVQPVTVRLSDETENKKETYQYVPIKESLKIFLEDDTYIAQKLADTYNHEEHTFKDTRDGLYFRENSFFKKNPEAVPLIVFQDELEVVNPLGAAKTMYKMNCTYYTTMDVQPALRSQVSSIQLVSLVLSRYWKKYGNEKCNEKFINDLKSLEVEGLTVDKPAVKNLKVGLAYIVGDNLGAHCISEISQSFNSGFICRWCKATYEDVCVNNHGFNECVPEFEPDVWTRSVYDRLATVAEEEGVAQDGVKGHCSFNKLDSFHCIGQMPPCLGKA